MTREEAIDILAESKRQNEVMRDNPSTFWVSHQMADGVKNAGRRIAALNLALSALRPVSRERLSGFKTCDLVGELRKREGVEAHIAEQYQDVAVSVNGPAVVLVVMD